MFHLLLMRKGTLSALHKTYPHQAGRVSQSDTVGILSWTMCSGVFYSLFLNTHFTIRLTLLPAVKSGLMPHLSPFHPLIQQGSQITISKGNMLPTLNCKLGVAFCFCFGGRLLVWAGVFSPRGEPGVLCCPLSQSSARLGPPCACMTWNYNFVVHVNQFLK